MNTVTLTGYIEVPESALDAVLGELATHIRLTKEEAGCLVFQVAQNPQHPTRFEVYEEFVDSTAFDLHQARVKSSRWGEITRNASRHYTVSSATQSTD